MDPILKRKLEWEKKETQAMIQNKKKTVFKNVSIGSFEQKGFFSNYFEE